jgi:hypothetical protein
MRMGFTAKVLIDSFCNKHNMPAIMLAFKTSEESNLSCTQAFTRDELVEIALAINTFLYPTGTKEEVR